MDTFQHAIFLDNDFNKITQVGQLCYKIKCIKINESSSYSEIPWNTDPLKSYMRDKISMLNSYVKLIKTLPKVIGDMYDDRSGINESNMNDLRQRVDALPKGESKAVIFDWDRTLTMFEGVFPYTYLMSKKLKPDFLTNMNNEQYHKQLLEDMLIYLFGGEERLQLIRRMLNELHAKGVTLFILTNNGSCGEQKFYPYIQALTPHIPIENMLCSAPFPYHGNKGLLLQNHPRFSNLSTPMHVVSAAHTIAPPPPPMGQGFSFRSRKRHRRGKKARRTTRRR